VRLCFPPAPLSFRFSTHTSISYAAHELGHWHGNHIPVLLLTGLAQIALTLTTYTVFLTNRPLLAAFGFHQPPPSALTDKLLHPIETATHVGPTIIALLLAATLFTPLNALLQFATNKVTRTLEYDADAFAVRQGEETASNLKKALVTIHEKNLVRPSLFPFPFVYPHPYLHLSQSLYGVDPLYSAYHHSHPTLVERLEALDAGIEKKKGKKAE
jgi:STE24 endopeptidase